MKCAVVSVIQNSLMEKMKTRTVFFCSKCCMPVHGYYCIVHNSSSKSSSSTIVLTDLRC